MAIIQILLLLLAGFAAGSINAVAGGGKLLVLPALVAAGLPPLTANITASLVLGPGAAGAVWQYRDELHRVQRKYFLLLMPCFVGAFVGIVLLRHTSGPAFQKLVPWLLLLAVVLFGLQPALGKYLHQPLRARPHVALPVIGLLLLITSVYGGYFGAGFGFVFMALLGFTSLQSIYQFSALKNIMGGGIELTAVAYFAVTGGIAWQIGLIAMVGCIAGGIFGARWALKIPQQIVRIVIVLVGLSLVGLILIRG